jgi:hypothetical protein
MRVICSPEHPSGPQLVATSGRNRAEGRASGTPSTTPPCCAALAPIAS